MQLRVSCRPCGLHGRLNTPPGTRNSLVRYAAEPIFEFLYPVATVHQVRVAIDEAWSHPQAVHDLNRHPERRVLAGTLRAEAQPCDALAFPRQGGIFEVAIVIRARDHGGN